MMHADSILHQTFVEHEWLAPDTDQAQAAFYQHLRARRRRTAQRQLAVLATAVAAGALSVGATQLSGSAPDRTPGDSSAAASSASGRASGSGAGEPPLIGTSWQLASYQDSAAADPVAVQTDSTIAFSASGRISAHACNFIGGQARIAGQTITTVGPLSSTDMACTGEPAALQRAVGATLTGSADWSIRAATLTLTNPDGHILTYRVRPSIYPNLTARTILAGTHAGGQFRLAVDGPADRPDLVFEERTAPGEAWGTAGVISPRPNDCLANHVLPAGQLGNETFLAAWATPNVAKITTRATDGATETPLTFYPIPGSTLRIAGLWTTHFTPSKSPVTFYDHSGAIIAAYPNGPC
jgi:heat shock protein HslJ